MSNQDADALTNHLKDIHIERLKALKNLEDIDKLETELIKDIRKARVTVLLENKETNHFVEEDILRITNHI